MENTFVNFVFLLVLVLVASNGLALPEVYPEKGSKVYRISDISNVEEGLQKLQNLQINNNYDFWTQPSLKDKTDIFVPNERISDFEKFMKDNGFTYNVFIDDVGRLIYTQKMSNKQGVEMNWDNYQRFDTMQSFVTQAVLAHPDIASIEEIGKSIEKRALTIVKIGIPVANKTKPAIFIDGGIHAREWISPAVTTYFINQLLNNHTSYTEMLTQVDLYIFPIVNPDGYEYSHVKDRLWRKNLRPDKPCAGVDLNRNFGYMWSGAGSSSGKCSEVYRGTEAFSEPESKAMQEYIEKKHFEGVNWQAYFTIHSYGQQWMLSWGWTYAYPVDYDELLKFGNVAVDALTSVYGTPYEIGTATQLGGAGAGGSDDWAKGSGFFKYVQTVEVRDAGEYGFLLPPDQIKDCAYETLQAVKATSKYLEDTMNEIIYK